MLTRARGAALVAPVRRRALLRRGGAARRTRAGAGPSSVRRPDRDRRARRGALGRHAFGAVPSRAAVSIPGSAGARTRAQFAARFFRAGRGPKPRCARAYRRPRRTRSISAFRCPGREAAAGFRGTSPLRRAAGQGERRASAARGRGACARTRPASLAHARRRRGPACVSRDSSAANRCARDSGMPSIGARRCRGRRCRSSVRGTRCAAVLVTGGGARAAGGDGGDGGTIAGCRARATVAVADLRGRQ